MKIIEIIEIKSRGLALFLDCQRFKAPPNPFSIEIISENGSSEIYEVTKEYVRRVPPGEIEVLFVPYTKPNEIKVGFEVRVISNENV